MCFFYSLVAATEELARQYKADFDFEYRSVYLANGFTFPKMAIINNDSPDKIQTFQWGLVPPFANDDEVQKYTLNARSETIFSKPSFRSAIKYKRCLIPATGFFEWKTVGKNKIPHHISLKSRKIFSFAGIWEKWVNKETGEIKHTYSIITCDANPLMAKIHNSKKRMPVILNQEDELNWLDKSLEKERIAGIMQPYDENDMEAYTISRLISKRSAPIDTPEVLEAQDYPEV